MSRSPMATDALPSDGMPRDALPFDALMLPPLVLQPPLGPHLVRGLVMALAVVFHVFTAGWSLIYNGREGELAGAARLMLQNGTWIPGPEWSGAPLAVWLSELSMALFGVNEFAVRLPSALAVVALVWFTFRLGEQFGGIWRGFVASMILLCSPGLATVARTLTPAPLTAAFLTATFYFLIRGFERRPGRRKWFLLAWVGLAFGCFAGGWRAALLPLGTLLLLMLFFREARIRFPALISWEGGAIAALTVAAMTALVRFVGMRELGFASGIPLSAMPVGHLIGWQFAMLFPWLLLLIPAALATVARWFQFRAPAIWSEVFPLAWAVVGMGLAMANPARNLADTVVIWPALALWGALSLETMPRRRFLRTAAGVIGLAAVAGFFFSPRLGALVGWAIPSMAASIPGIPAFFWSSVTSVAWMAILAFVLLGGVAFWFETRHERRAALLAFFAAMIPAEFAFTDATAKFAPYFSYADFAHSIGFSGHSEAAVWTDSTPYAASSLIFYLPQPFLQVAPEDPNLKAQWVGEEAGERIYLISNHARLPDWKRAFDGRVQIASESGGNVLLTNQ